VITPTQHQGMECIVRVCWPNCPAKIAHFALSRVQRAITNVFWVAGYIDFRMAARQAASHREAAFYEILRTTELHGQID
jgi:hypothetical protein